MDPAATMHSQIMDKLIKLILEFLVLNPWQEVLFECLEWILIWKLKSCATCQLHQNSSSKAQLQLW